MTILVADDEPVSRRLLEATLTRLGHTVVAVSNGLDARAALLGADGPRLAILDWMMPGIDGLAVCRALRHQAAHYIYVILLTAHSRPEDLVAGLGAEADDFLTKPFNIVELDARIRSGQRILELEERLVAAQEALRYEATHDRLTGLWNRGVILDHLTRELQRARRWPEPLSVAVVDIDHFKAINDTYGHTAGDAVLRETAQRMQAVLRDVDSIGRCGGEEFLVVLPSCGDGPARTIGERIRSAVGRAPIMVGPDRMNVTASVGLASAPPAGGDVAALIQAADGALYQAKALGRNRVHVAESVPDVHQPEAPRAPGASEETSHSTAPVQPPA